jgi:hypothetical protein
MVSTTIVSFAAIKQDIRARLMERPSRELPSNDLANILATHLNIVFTTEDDRMRFARLKFWLSQPDLDDAKIVCANVELVRMGAIEARPFRGNMGEYTPPCLAHPKDLNKWILEPNKITYFALKQYAEPVESFARRIDATIQTGESLVAPRVEEIDPNSRNKVKSDKPGTKFYITVRDLLKCIAHGRNTTALNEFCMYYTASMQIYLQISGELKSQIVDDQSNQILSLKNLILEMQESADRQRAEILGETKHARNEAKLAKEEVVKAREDISDLHETIIDHHEIAMKTAQHTSVDVKPAQRQYFAMTAYSRVGDNTGKLFFKNWRRQAVSMTSVLVNAMSGSSTDKDGNQYTAHSLIIPPIYFAGAVNLGNAGKYNLDKFVKSKISELNRSRERGDKLTMTGFKNMIGLSTSSIHPTWTPNEHMSHCEFVDCFLDVIKNTKIIKLSVAEPKLQAQIDTKQRECFQSLINLTGKAREDIDGMIAKVRDEMSTPPPSDDDEYTTDTE